MLIFQRFLCGKRHSGSRLPWRTVLWGSMTAGFVHKGSEVEHDDTRNCSAVYRGECSRQGTNGRGLVELARSRAGCARLHRRLGVAESRRVLEGPRGNPGISAAEVGCRTGLPSEEEAVGISPNPDGGGLRV